MNKNKPEATLLMDNKVVLELTLDPGDGEAGTFEVRAAPFTAFGRRDTQVLYGGRLLATLSEAWHHGVLLQDDEARAAYLGTMAAALKESQCAPGTTREALATTLRTMAAHLQSKPRPNTPSTEANNNASRLHLDCPKCRMPHVDRGEWATRLHKTHLCEYCGEKWQPSNQHTFGIEQHRLPESNDW